MKIEISKIQSQGIQKYAEKHGIAYAELLGDNGEIGDKKITFYSLGGTRVAETNGDPIWEEDAPEAFAAILPKFTRKDYSDGKCSHEEYYTQIVNRIGLERFIPFFPVSIEGLLRAHQSDAHFNSIPLAAWDHSFAHLAAIESRVFKEHGDFLSLGGHVCAMKQAARMYIIQKGSCP